MEEMMFTKDDIAIDETYSPSNGHDKDIYIFPRLKGGNAYWNFFRSFSCHAEKDEEGVWHVTMSHSKNCAWRDQIVGVWWDQRSRVWFETTDRISISTILKFINDSEKSERFYRHLVKECFSESFKI